MFKRSWLVLVVLAFFGARDASATTLNFRGSGWEPANGHTSQFFNLSGPIDLTVQAVNGRIYWDDEDGFGISGRSYEDDEIEGSERLILSFSHAVELSTIWLSDLFVEHGYREHGWYSLDNGPARQFAAVSGNGGNLAINIPNLVVSTITFGAPGAAFGRDHEFAVSGVSYTAAAPVPEPASFALLGAGLLGAAFRRRNKAVV